METVRRRRSLSVLAGLSALLIVLGVVFYVTEPEEETTSDGTRRLITTPVEEIREIVISPAERETVRLRSSSDGWALVEPVRDKANGDSVDSLLEVLQNIVGTRLFEEGDPELGELSDFGLDTGSGLVLAVIDETGEREELVLGETIPLDVGYVYTLDTETGDVFEVYRDVKKVAQQDVGDLRERSVTEIDPEDIRTVEIDDGRRRFVVERSGEWWEFREPRAEPADARAVSELLKSLSELEAKEFPSDVVGFSESAEGEDANREENADQVTVRLTHADGTESWVRLGREYEEGLILVESDARDHPYGVTAETIKEMPLSRERFENRSPLRFSPESIERVEVESDGDRMEVENREGEWWITRPMEQPASSSRVARALGALARMEVEEPAGNGAPAPDVPDPAERSELSVRLIERDGTVHGMWLMDIDHRSDGVAESSTDTLIGKSTFRETPFIVERESLSGFPVSAFEFADRQLVSFRGGDAGRVDITTGGTTLRIEKRQNTWVIVEPERVRADQPVVWNMLFSIEDLEYTSVVSDEGDPAKLREQGADAIMIEIWGEDGEEFGTVTLAPGDGEGALAASKARDGIFQVQEAVLERIPRRARELEFRR